MPTYDFKCCGWPECKCIAECSASMDTEYIECPKCGKPAYRQFSPSKNIFIPGHFRMDRGWHLAPNSEAGDASLNNRVHKQERTSFKKQFDKNWKTAGGA
jgi:predicted nucleic acid-binding Zn ribbon protein